MAFVVKTAERKNVKLKIGMSAASGHGKTMSSLLLAFGMTGDWKKVGLIDTEQGSGELYSHLGPYKYLRFDPPYAPDNYIEAMKAMVKEGVEVMIVDSVSHEWDGVGGCLEIVERLKPTMRNEFGAWGKVTPMHKKFIDAILQSPVHLITTTRRKQDWVLEENSKGKQAPKKVGMKEIQREGFEYELTVSFEFDKEHQVLASKDRTGLFGTDVPFVITAETGKKIKEWNESGAAAAPVEAPKPAPVAGPLPKIDSARVDAISILKELTPLHRASKHAANAGEYMQKTFNTTATSKLTTGQLQAFAKWMQEDLATSRELEKMERELAPPASPEAVAEHEKLFGDAPPAAEVEEDLPMEPGANG